MVFDREHETRLNTKPDLNKTLVNVYLIMQKCMDEKVYFNIGRKLRISFNIKYKVILIT